MAMMRVVCLTSALLCGCAGGSGPSVASSAQPTQAALDPGLRSVRVADGVFVHATRWDGARLRAVGPAAPAWLRAGASGRTSFTVVVDVVQRGFERTAEEAALRRPQSWSFALTSGQHSSTDPRSVELVGVDRFPADGGGHHHRLVFAVHFEPPSAGPGGDVQLRIRCAALLGTRPALGRRVARHGIELEWNMDDA